MRYAPRALLAGGLGLAVAFLTACGSSSGLLSPSEASSLTSQLNAASADIANQNCVSADRLIGNIQTQIPALPGSVNPTLVSDLSRGAATVLTLARKDCGAPAHPAPTTTPKSTPTTTSTPTVTHTTSTSTVTTPTSTVTTPTTPTSSTPTTTSTPSTPTPPPGTTSTGSNGGAGLPTTGTGSGPGGDGSGNGQ